MSEYQYYEFLAIDEALDARQMGELRALSTRARITPTSFVNTYHWGDFKGDPRVLMERYFDAFLYLANWGTRLIMIRLPSSLLDLETAGRYCTGDAAWAWQAGDKVVVGLTQEGADDYWDEDDGTSLGLIVPARAELAAGDRRLLYLAWLLSAGAGEVADDELEPAVPAGLASLSPSLRAVFEFLHVDGDLLAAAAEASEPLGAIEPSGSELSRWVTNLSVKEKDVLLTRLLGRDAPNVRLELSRRVRDDAHEGPEADGIRSVGELREAAARIRERREQLAAKRKAEEKARAARAHAAARERHLSALALRQEQAWQRVRAAIDTRQPGQYDAAVELLGDLRAVGEREGRLPAFERQLQDLRQQHSKKPSLLRRLDQAGLGPRGPPLGFGDEHRGPVADRRDGPVGARGPRPGRASVRRVAPQQTGSLGFIAVEGSVDWRPVRREGRPGADTSPPELHPRISRSTPSALYVSIARRSRVASRSRCSSAAAPTSAS